MWRWAWSWRQRRGQRRWRSPSRASYIFVGLAYTEMASAYPIAGGGQYFTLRGLGDFWGLVAGAALMLDYTLVEARRSLRNVYGKEKGRRFIRRLRQMVRQHFQVVPTPSPDQVQAALSEVSDPADALILAACKGANCLVLLTYNTRHFLRAKRVQVLTPRNFLERLRRALRRVFGKLGEEGDKRCAIGDKGWRCCWSSSASA